VSDDEAQLREQLKAAANADKPPAQLAERVVANLAYRARLEAPFVAQARARRLRLAAIGAVALAAAAAVWMSTHAPPPARIAAELARDKPANGSPPAGIAASASSSAPAKVAGPCRERAVAAGKSPLLDDFEDGDDGLAPLEQRAGFWRWARESDAPGTAPALIPVPRAEASPRNKLALHVKGGRLLDWGATVEVNFSPPCYDASAYGGIKLQARGPGRIYVALREVGVIPRAEGGTCERDCHNPHVAKIELSREWRSYEFRWADLRQRGLATPPLDPSRLHSVAFLIRPEDTPYDVWLDDVRFLVKGS
jgi:hypothetical protein